jgi:drug/metabolite transporter (DMT)-like permease
MTRAYQADELSKISSMKYLGIVYAMIFGYVFFGEMMSVQVHLGIALVLVGVVLNLLYKHFLSKSSK